MYKYFSDKLSKAFLHLYAGRMIIRLAGSLMGLFLPIFLYQFFGNNIINVFIFYLISAFLYGSLVPWTTKYLNKIGLRRSLHLSIFFGSGFYVLFYLLEKFNFAWEFSLSNGSLYLFMVIIVVLTCDRLTHWVPFHTDLAKFTKKNDRAKELSLMEATSIGLGAGMPILGGWIITVFSYETMFLLVAFIYLSSLTAFLRIPRTEEKYCWTYKEAWENLLSKSRRKTVLAFIAEGAEGVVGGVIWPIFIWLLLSGNYFEVGALSSVIVVATVFFQLLAGGFIDTRSKDKVMKYGSILYALGWIIKIFIGTAFQIFLASTYHNFTRIFSRTTFDALFYEKAADEGHYVDEFTVLHEMALQIGRFSMYVFCIIVVTFFGIQWTFVLAALASIFMTYLVNDEKFLETEKRIFMAPRQSHK